MNLDTIKEDCKRFDKLPVATQAALVWPECGPVEGQRRIRVGNEFNEKYPDGLPDDFGALA